MDTILWRVETVSAPKITRHCKRCGVETEHLCSDLFRVNAQKKSLDVWLIYRCSKCKSTWNLTVLSRINPKSIDSQLLDQYMNNDSALARQCSMNYSLHKQNGVKAALPEYRIIGADANLGREQLRIEIIPDYPMDMRVSKIIREKLRLSQRELDELITKGFLQSEDGADLHRIRLLIPQIILINPDTTS